MAALLQINYTMKEYGERCTVSLQSGVLGLVWGW